MTRTPRSVRGFGLVLIVVGQTILVVAGLLFVYWLLPIQQRFDGQWVLKLAGGLLITGVVLAWQVHSIWHSHFPVVRAVRALVTGLSIFVLVFAVTYVSVSRQEAGSFSEPLGKVGALYFAVTVVATVGFGDIVPRTDLARAITTAQMLLDLIFVATAGRVLVTSATRRASTRGKPDAES